MTRVADLTADRLAQLPEPCRSCTFWEVGPGRPARTRGTGAEGKEAWVQAAQLEWGAPGRVILDDGKVIGFAVFAPGKLLGGSHGTGPAPSPDALVLATAWMAPDRRGAGQGRHLMQVAAREAHAHGLEALEAVAWRGEAQECHVGEEFLLAAGFAVHREHPTRPLLRLDLRRTARWTRAVGHALQGVLDGVTEHGRVPAPEGRPNASSSLR